MLMAFYEIDKAWGIATNFTKLKCEDTSVEKVMSINISQR